MRKLSKSKLLAYRQCPKRLWLEIHRPELRQDSAATQASFAVGHAVGDIARQLHDPDGKGALIDVGAEGYEAALERSQKLLKTSQPIFEAGFAAEGVLAFADVMLPERKGGKRVWRMIEVKSSTSVKDYHRDDCAIQSYIARRAGVPLASIALAHIDSDWVYPGKGDYQGLLRENDLTEEALAREDEVKAWITHAHAAAAKAKEPKMAVGKHCTEPFECGFLGDCQSRETQAEYPVQWLPSIQSRKLRERIAAGNIRDMREVPDEWLNDMQRRVRDCSLSGKPYFDRKGAAAALEAHKLPAYFIDFETIQFAAPIWKGTRPYQQIPFQFSVHRLSRTGKLKQTAFLDLSGRDPSKGFAEALIDACGERGPVYVYNTSFEKGRLDDLARRHTRLRDSLQAIAARIVDLHPIAHKHYYHPDQHGSWSIKQVLPALAPDLRHADLDGVQDGSMAMSAYAEAIAPETSRPRKKEIERQLLAYCALDTLAMVYLWRAFSGRDDIDLPTHG